jgi:hypothetical protein
MGATMAFQYGDSIEVEKTADEVYDYLMQTDKDRDWRRPYVVSSRQLTSGPPAVGSQYETVYRFLGVKAKTVVEVVEHDPPTILAWKQVSEGPVVTTHGAYTLTPQDGRPRVTIRQDAKATGLARLVEPLLARYLNRVTRRMVRQLKEALG